MESVGLVADSAPFAATVRVFDASDALAYSGACSRAPTRQAAAEGAAADALRGGGVVFPPRPRADPSGLKADAWLGDAAQHFALALLGHQSGLPAGQCEAIARRLLTNEALEVTAPAQLPKRRRATVSTATEVEAALGRRLAPHADALLALLWPALSEANPALAKALPSAVAKAKR